MHSRLSLTLAIAAAGSIALAGCSSGGSASGGAGDQVTAKGGVGNSSAQKKLDALYKAAQKSGETKVVAYGPGEDIYQPVYQIFMKRFPKIKVTGDFIFGSELNSRLNQEFSSGKHIGDLQTGAGPMTAAADGQKRCASYKPFTGGYLSGDEVGPDNRYHATNGWAYGIEYNTNQLTKKQAPKGWSELVEPKWKGKLVHEDLTTVTGTTNTIANLAYAGKLDKAWLTKLKGSKALIAPNRAVASQDVANGKREVNLVVSYDTVLQAKRKHLPVGFVFPTSDGSRLEYHYTCMLKGAPSPDATKLLINWMLTPEGQNAFAAIGAYGLRPGSTPPPDLPKLSSIEGTLVKSPPVSKQSDATKNFIGTATKVFG